MINLKQSILWLCLCLPTFCVAQSNTVDDPLLGISFEMPTGWSGINIPNGYALANHEQQQGMLMHTLEMPMDMVISKINQEKFFGDEEEEMSLIFEFKSTGDGQYEGMLKGKMEGPGQMTDDVHAFVVFVKNPYAYGMMVMSMRPVAQMNEEVKELTRTVASSIQFAKPNTSKSTGQWEGLLAGKRSIMIEGEVPSADDYSDEDYSEEDYSEEEDYEEEEEMSDSKMYEITLCKEGAFSMFIRSEDGEEQIKGAWTVESVGQSTLLKLNKEKGGMLQFTLAKGPNGEFTMNGYETFLYPAIPVDCP